MVFYIPDASGDDMERSAMADVVLKTAVCKRVEFLRP